MKKKKKERKNEKKRRKRKNRKTKKPEERYVFNTAICYSCLNRFIYIIINDVCTL